MVGHSSWPALDADSDSSHPIDAWRQDPELLNSFGECFRIRPRYARGSRMFHKTVQCGDWSIAATAASSPLIHDCVPSPATGERRFFVLMPNRPRHVALAAGRWVQQPGECAIADSTLAHTASYQHPHASLCLSVADATLRDYVAEPSQLVGMRFSQQGTLSRLVPSLLRAVWAAAECEASPADARQAANALLGVIACCYTRSSAPAVGATKINCGQVKKFIDIEIRNPELSVQFVAQRIGVTTRYLQLLFAQEQECLSQYIKRERLLGCLLDLRDGDCDHQSITEIAFSWGFNSAAHFSSSFKSEFGLNPRDYRACDQSDLEALGGIGEQGALIQAALLLGRRVNH